MYILVIAIYNTPIVLLRRESVDGESIFSVHNEGKFCNVILQG